MGKYKEFIRHMLMWLAALASGIWEMARGFMKRHPFLTLFVIWVGVSNPLLGFAAILVILLVWMVK